jgi:hypothetical protein
LDIRLGRGRHGRRRHLAGTQLIENLFPLVAVLGEQLRAGEGLQIQAARLECIAVTTEAGLGEEGSNRILKWRGSGLIGPGNPSQQQAQRRQKEAGEYSPGRIPARPYEGIHEI